LAKDKNGDKKSSGMTTKKMMLIGSVFLILTFVITFMSVSFMMNKNSDKAGDKVVKEAEKIIETEHLPLGEDFIVNLAEVGTKRYIKANVTVAYNIEDEKFIEELDKNIVVLRDATITYLKGRTEEQLKDLDGLKNELVKELNKQLKVDSTIVDAYFQSFLIQ
jgi:flagellar FliL protein